MKIYSNILGTIGSTPIVKINSLNSDNLFVKLEYFNPASSIKDRPAYNILKSALDRGEINKDTVIIEATSGNMGIGLALASSVLGLKFIAVMPESMSIERRKILKAYGAEVVLTSREGGMQECLNVVFSLQKKYPNSYLTKQFGNPDNPNAHYNGTAKEIFEQTDGKVDVVVSTIGTGGTIVGISKKLKELKPDVKIIGIEADESPLLTKGHSAPHKIQGISANFVPKILDLSLIDEIITVKGDDAIKSAREFAKKEGILTGYSGGAVLSSLDMLSKKYENKMIIGILPDSGERYLSGELYE